YERLRETCHTDVDGTSIDTIEEIAVQLGLDAEQIMVPPDFLLFPEAEVMPAIVVVRLPNNATHFLIAWRRHGGIIQLMDPASGRRWQTAAEFVRSLYVHTIQVPEADWREWAGSEKFSRPLQSALIGIGLHRVTAAAYVNTALKDAGWHSLAAVEAAARMI